MLVTKIVLTTVRLAGLYTHSKGLPSQRKTPSPCGIHAMDVNMFSLIERKGKISVILIRLSYILSIRAATFVTDRSYWFFYRSRRRRYAYTHLPPRRHPSILVSSVICAPLSEPRNSQLAARKPIAIAVPLFNPNLKTAIN